MPKNANELSTLAMQNLNAVVEFDSAVPGRTVALECIAEESGVTSLAGSILEKI